MVEYAWRGELANDELGVLHAEGFGYRLPVQGPVPDRLTRLHRHSLGWVAAREGTSLIGFVNVCWDGGEHAFLLDTLVAAAARHRGVGTAMVSLAVRHARVAGCAWLHVDFEAHLRPFYLEAAGFTATDAGLIAL